MPLTQLGEEARNHLPLFFGSQHLFSEQQGVAGNGHPTETVIVFSSFSGELEAGIDNLRPLRAVMKKRLGPSSPSNVFLEATLHDLAHQFEKADEVRLS